MTSLIRQYLKQARSYRTLREEVFVGLQLVANRLMEPWEQYLKEHADLTEVQYNVLRILRGAGAEGLWASEVGERLVTRSPDVTRLIDRLEKRGLVRRSRDPADRRAVRVHITEEGLERIAPFDELAPVLLGQVFDDLGDERLGELRDILDKILAALSRPR